MLINSQKGATAEYSGPNPPDGWLLSDVPIDWTRQQYVDGNIIDKPLPPAPTPYVPPTPTAAEIEASRISQLNSQFAATAAELKSALGTAQLRDDSELIAELKFEYSDAVTLYGARRDLITAGNTDWAVYGNDG